MCKRNPYRLSFLIAKLCLLLAVAVSSGSQGMAQCEPGGFCQVGFQLVDFDTYLAFFGGKVAIGTVSPIASLHAFGNETGFRLQSTQSDI